MKHVKKKASRFAAAFLALAMLVTSVPQYALTAQAAEAVEKVSEVETTAAETDTAAVEETADEEKAEAASEPTEPASKAEETETQTQTERQTDDAEAVTKDLQEGESQEEPSQEEPSQEEPSKEEPSKEEPSQDPPAQEEEPLPYKATLSYNQSELTVYIDNGESVTDEEGNKKWKPKWEPATEIPYGEEDWIEFYAVPKDADKGVSVTYTTASGKTADLPFSDWDQSESEFWYELNTPEEDITITFTLADTYTVTFESVNKYADGLSIHTAITAKGAEIDEDNDYDGLSLNKTSENGNKYTAIKGLAGTELRFYLDGYNDYGTLTAKIDGKEVPTYEFEEWEGYYSYRYIYTPTGDITVTLDIIPEEVLLDVEEGIAFQIFNRDTEEEITLTENNSIAYYESGYYQLKIKEVEGKRFDVVFEDANPKKTYEVEMRKEDGFYFYDFTIGHTIGGNLLAKIIVKSYGQVNVRFTKDVPEDYDYSLDIRLFSLDYDPDDPKNADNTDQKEKEWSVKKEIGNDEGTTADISADKDGALYFGICYSKEYKLDYVSPTGDANGNLKVFDTCEAEDIDYYNTKKNWTIYRFVPTQDTAISIKLSEFEQYTLTVIRTDNVTSYTIEASNDDLYYYGKEDKTWTYNGTVKEDAIITISDIHALYPVHKVTYKIGENGALREADVDYSSYYYVYHKIKMTGDTTIYIDTEASTSYTVTFENTDQYNTRIWERGSFSDTYPLTYNQITKNSKAELDNDKAYCFNVTGKDGYIVDSVVSVDADGNETVLEYVNDDSSNYRGYQLAYGQMKNLTIKVHTIPAYTLSFDVSDTDASVYSWSEKTRISEVAVPSTESYSFYHDLDSAEYDVTLAENEYFTLTKDYRYYGHTRTVYTIKPKAQTAQLPKKATIHITKKAVETHELTFEYANDDIRDIDLITYNDDGTWRKMDELTDKKATVDSMAKALRVKPYNGYEPVVTRAGETLTSFRTSGDYFEYYLGEITADETITITVKSVSAQTSYGVGFSTMYARITDPVTNIAYRYEEYINSDGEYIDPSYTYDYYVTKGESISFKVEPYFGYKVDSVLVNNRTKITPDASGIYTVTPATAHTGILVKTVKGTAQTPENPDDPEKKMSTVRFQRNSYDVPTDIIVQMADENGVFREIEALTGNALYYQISVETGKQISFKVILLSNCKLTSVKIGEEDVPYDAETELYTTTINADTEIVITADRETDPDPDKKMSTVRFQRDAYSGSPTDIIVKMADENGEFREIEKLPENTLYYQISVETGKQISFKAEVTDERYKINSVTADGADVPYDAETELYTMTINADTEIVITTDRKTDPDPEKKYAVHFSYPSDVKVDVWYKYDAQTDYIHYANDAILSVEKGTNIWFDIICEGYYTTPKVNGNEAPRDINHFCYVLTVDADTEVVIEAKKITAPETNYPTQVKVKNVSSKGELNLSKTSADYEITLTPADADGSVLGIRPLENSVIKASITSKTAGGRTRYYLTLEKPESSVGDSADIIIYNTATGADIEGGTFKVITRAPSTGNDEPDASGLKVYFDGYDETETASYTYTGSPITPWIEVAYNGIYLEQGVDYTVKYANNVNVSTDAKPAKLTITGKGSLTGNHAYTFKITPKNIDSYDVKAGSIKVVANAKATPVLVYNGALLTKKDFTNPDAGRKFTASGTITLTGTGNFTGTREVSVEVVDKNALNKISIKFDKDDNAKNKNLAYDGTEKYPAFHVLDAKKTDITNKQDAYIVVYPEDVTSAGTVKFTVVGIGEYTGSVTKSYKIKPSALLADSVKVSEPSAAGYTFVSTGVTEYNPDVKLNDGTWLERGRDYTLTYSNNKKVGTGKCKLSFIGNYKGVKAITKTFTIKPFNLSDFDDANIITADKVSKGKPGMYKSVPYIIDNEADVLVKPSEFKFTYYTDEQLNTQMGKLSSGQIWVKIEPKNAAKGNYTGTRTVSYYVRESGKDLAKAKIAFNPNKPSYTGGALKPECSVDGTSIKNNENFNVRYLNNVNKGKATVIITANPGSDYVGGKTAGFTIGASKIQ